MKFVLFFLSGVNLTPQGGDGGEEEEPCDGIAGHSSAVGKPSQ